MTLFYVDVSEHDRNRRGAPLDWAAIRKATSPIMCARATYGDPQGVHFPTSYFREFQSGARSAGFVFRGGYHDLVRGDALGVARQVDWLCRELDATGANWAMLDVEPFGELTAVGAQPDADTVDRWFARWDKIADWPCVSYIPHWVWDSYLYRMTIPASFGPLVASNYAGSGGTPITWYASAGGDKGLGWAGYGGRKQSDIWQFASSLNVPGASGLTDVNAFRGTLDDFDRLLGGAGMPTAEENAQALLATKMSSPSLGVTWTVGDWLKRGEGARRAVEELSAKVDALTAKVDALATGGVDVNALGAAVAAAPALAGLEEVRSDMEAVRSALSAAAAEITRNV